MRVGKGLTTYNDGMILKDALIVTSRSDAPLGDLDVRVASLGIADGIIRCVGPYEMVKRKCPHAAEEMDCGAASGINYLVMPGFVDAHTHSRQMALQGYWESGWQVQHSKPQGEQEASDLFRWFVLDAVKAGVTFVCDWPEHPHLWNPKPLDQELRAAGLRGCLRVLLPHNRGEAWPSPAESVEKLRQTLRGLDNLVQLGIWIPEEDRKEFNDSILKLLGQLQEAKGGDRLSFQMHLAESRRRKEACPRALARLLENDLLRFSRVARTVLIHAIWLDPEETDVLIGMKDHVGVVTCPKFMDGRIAPIKELLVGGVPVGLGSDVAVPDQFQLISDLLSLHRSREEPLQISFGEAFYTATLGGAKVFGLEKRIGSIEEGKDADLILVRNPAAIDPQLFVAQSNRQERQKIIERLFTRNVLRREHVEKVLVQGRVVMEGGVIVSLAHQAVIEAAGKRTALAIVKRLQDRGKNE